MTTYYAVYRTFDNGDVRQLPWTITDNEDFARRIAEGYCKGVVVMTECGITRPSRHGPWLCHHRPIFDASIQSTIARLLTGTDGRCRQGTAEGARPPRARLPI